MKLVKSILFAILISFSLSAVADRGVLPPGNAKVYPKDTSTTNLPATYGAAANSYATSLTGVSNICAFSTVATKIYLTTSTVSNCTGAVDMFVLPASASTDPVCYHNVKINPNVCARSSSGTLSSGIVDLVIW